MPTVAARSSTSGLSNSRQTISASAQTPAAENDEAVAARQVKGLALRPRVDEEQHPERDQQDRRLDPGEDLQRRARVRERRPCPGRTRPGTRAGSARTRARPPRPPVKRDSGGSEAQRPGDRGHRGQSKGLLDRDVLDLYSASRARVRGRAIHQSIRARSAISSSRAASASWRASSGGSGAARSRAGPRAPAGRRRRSARVRPLALEAGRRRSRRRARARPPPPRARAVGRGVGRVHLRAHLAERVLQRRKLTSSDPSENDADDGR